MQAPSLSSILSPAAVTLGMKSQISKPAGLSRKDDQENNMEKKSDKKTPRKFPTEYEYPNIPEKYTQEFVAVDRIELVDSIRQNSDYDDDNKAAPDNNIFFEERSNPLSSKGN